MFARLTTRLKRLLPTGVGMMQTQRSIMLAPLVGVVAGLGAMAFHMMCLLVAHFAMSQIAGYDPASSGNEAGYREIFHQGGAALASHGQLILWLLILVPTVGGLISGIIVYRFAPEAEGHGTDAAINAYHHKQGRVRARVPLVKMISAALTLGSGGSGGREGPIAQIGSGFGSFLATRLKLSDSDRRILMVAGMGAGIGAIFHAPLAGAIFSIEVLYRDPEFEAEALIPSFIATAISYCVFSIAMFVVTQRYAFDPLFMTPENLDFQKPWLLVPLTGLAVAMSLASWGYVRCFYSIHNGFKKLRIPNMFKPAVGALLTGILAVAAFATLRATHGTEAATDSLGVLAFGYGFLQKILIAGDGQLLIPVLLVVGLGKILTTSLTIGSGGSGGVFGPSMVIGGALGAVVGLVFHHWLLPGVVEAEDVVIFAILGMASFFSAAANTPVSTLIMVSELTASYKLLLPSMWVCALSYIISHRWSLYIEQVKGRLESPAHRGDFIIDVLEGMTVKEVVGPAHHQFTAVEPAMPLKQMIKLLTGTKQICFPVIDSDDKYLGLFGLNDIRQFLYDSDLAELAVAEDLLTEVVPLTMHMDLSSAIGRFAQGRFEELPVVDDQVDADKVVGLLRRQDVIAAYSSQLLAMRTE